MSEVQVRVKWHDSNCVTDQHHYAQVRRRPTHRIGAGVFSIDAASIGFTKDHNELAHTVRQAVIELGSK